MREQNQKYCFLFAAGGTGGHLFPALSIAEEIKMIKPASQILFVGTKNKIESRLVPEHGYNFVPIWISGLSRGLNPKNLVFPLKVMVSVIQSYFIILKFKPSAVIGTGGYVCAPVLFVSHLLGIKTFIHESNSYPGLVTRILSNKVDRVFLAYENTIKYLKPNSRFEIVGTPVRNNLKKVSRDQGLEYFNLSYNKKTLLAVGGSSGATSINKALMKTIKKLVENNIQIIWQTGIYDYESVNDFIQSQDTSVQKNIRINKFIERMDYAYAAADLVLCRAGALTLAELTFLGKPAILVPYPYAAGNHQYLNAQTLRNNGAAELVKDNELNQRIEDLILNIISNDDLLKKMSSASLSLSKPHAAKEITEIILSTLN